MNIREQVKEQIPRLQALAKAVSELDVLQCFATISEERHYVKPVFSEDRKLVLKDGRHPVVEKVLQSQEYVPNDCFMDADRELLLITGPNMSGKSTYMRQIALTQSLPKLAVMYQQLKRYSRFLIKSLLELVRQTTLFQAKVRLWSKCLKQEMPLRMQQKTV